MALALAAGGCSYSPSPSLFPTHLKTLAVPILKNETTEPNLEQEVTQAIVDRFVQDNKLRVEATMAVFYDYVASDTGAFKLVFESDLTNEPAVRARVDRVTVECAKLIAHVIADDTGLPAEQSQLLAVSLVGMGQVSARFWLTEGGTIDRAEAASLVSGLAWRGIRGYPRTDEHR
jgi:hypothetical protein